MSIVSIVINLEHNNLSKKIEEFSFALLLFLRSFSQLLRLFFFLKNQKDVKVKNLLFRIILKKLLIFLQFLKKKSMLFKNQKIKLTT